MVWDIVRQIPPGQVSTYGQVASVMSPPAGVDPLEYARLGARWVGSAMHAVPSGSDVPWQRVINSKGEISPRRRSEGHVQQRYLLEAEGVTFDAKGRTSFDIHGWDGPPAEWLEAHGLVPPKPLREQRPDDGGEEQLSLF